MDDFHQGILGFIFTCHIREADTLLGFDIDTGIGFADVEAHGTAAVSSTGHAPHEQTPEGHCNDQRHDPLKQEFNNRRSLFLDVGCEGYIVF